MSTLTGQSLLHPLQARQRSSASRTAFERQPSLIVESPWPSSISNSSRDRPRGRVLFVHRRLVGGAHHHAVLVAVLAALADADAARRRHRERVVVVGIAEVRRALVVRGPVAAEPQVLVERGGRDDLAGVHLVLWVEDRLQLAERAHDDVAEHDRQQLAAALAVAVLAGERAAVGGDEVGRHAR